MLVLGLIQTVFAERGCDGVLGISVRSKSRFGMVSTSKSDRLQGEWYRAHTAHTCVRWWSSMMERNCWAFWIISTSECGVGILESPSANRCSITSSTQSSSDSDNTCRGWICESELQYLEREGMRFLHVSFMTPKQYLLGGNCCWHAFENTHLLARTLTHLSYHFHVFKKNNIPAQRLVWVSCEFLTGCLVMKVSIFLFIYLSIDLSI